MLRDITIGKYYNTDSVIHKLDPRVKLAGTILFIIAVFLCDSPYAYIITAVYLAVLVKVSGVPFGYMVRGLNAVVALILLSSSLNILLTPGMDVALEAYGIRITYSGIRKAVYMASRIVCLILGASLMTYTTTPGSITDGIEKSLNPLNKVKVPVHEFAVMMSLVLRFIPVLMDEADKIIKAQQARGAVYDEGNIIVRIRYMISLIVPIFSSAIRKADEIAVAMDARGYRGGEGRTKMKPLKYKGRDYAGYAVSVSYAAVIIVVRWYTH